MKLLHLVLASSLAAMLTVSIHANPRRHGGIRLPNPPTIDGKLDPQEWPAEARLETFVDPVTGAPLADATYGFLAYDDQAIYLAMRCDDSQPAQMIGREIAYGADFDDEDHIYFTVNPVSLRTYDGRSTFKVSLINTQRDSLAGGRASKREWRGEWQSATSRDENGWTVEARIPWGMLQFSPGKGRTLDFNLGRFQARTRSLVQWSNQGLQQRPELLGFWEGVDLPSVKRRTRPEFLGYVAPEFDDPDFRVNAGLDIRYALTPRSTALLSVNPDFRNIEGQVTGIEFTRSERFVGETRPFFNEGSGFFNLTEGFSFGTMFYSQRIPRFDYGSKYFGNLSDTVKLGVLGTVQAGGQSAAVGNLAFNPGPNGSSNLYFTHSDDRRRTNNTVGGNYWTRNGNFMFDAQLAGEQDARGGVDGAHSASIQYAVPNFFSMIRYRAVDPGFRPALALIPFTDQRGFYWYTEYERDLRTGPIRSWGWEFYAEKYKTYAGDNFASGYDLGGELTTRSDIRFDVSYNSTDFFKDDDRTWNARVIFNESNRFKRFGLNYREGTQAQEDSRFVNLFGSYRLGKIDLGATYSVLELGKTNRLFIGTVGWEIDAKQTVSARVVQRDDDTNAYLSYRLAGGRGMETFLIWGDPNARTTQSRLAVKLVWAF